MGWLGSSCSFHRRDKQGKIQTLHRITVVSREQQQEMIRALDTTNLRPVTDASFPLTEIREAFQMQESRRHFGKICLTY
jgi:NADPH:quinone reductase-like Zn-dependent oxidoreductase